jgi:exopolyphosphatase/guanosine-5'-triphosphate,3'-diphosphate pyrophosphatase
MDDHHPEWGPFGVPLFDGPEARRCRVGVIDIGSNSVRLVVFDGAARSPAYFFNEKILCGLGAGFSETGRLNPEGRARAMVALRRFAALAEGMEGVTASDRGDGCGARRERRAGVPGRGAGGNRAWRSRSSPATRRRVCRRRACCWAGRVRRGWCATSAARPWNWRSFWAGARWGCCQTSDLGPLKLMGLKGGKKAMRAHIKARVAESGRGFSRPTRTACSSWAGPGAPSRGSTWSGVATR